MTIKEICEAIFALEKDYSLFDKKIKGVYFWKLIRFSLFIRLAQAFDLYGEAHTGLDKSERLKTILLLFVQNWRFDVAKRKKNVEVMVFENPRYVVVDNQTIDPYTNSLVNELIENQTSYEIVDQVFQGKHQKVADFDRSYDGVQSILYYANKVAKMLALSFSNKDAELISMIESGIKGRLSLTISLTSLIKRSIVHYSESYRYYFKALGRRRPKRIYLVCSYGKESLISAANDLGIESIELQHGTMSRFHLGYSFPNQKEVPYFPNKMLMFGSYWSSITPIPLCSDKVEYVGNKYLDDRIKDYDHIKKKKNTVLFISQGIIGKELSKLAVSFAIENSQFDIIYKLHPGEYIGWEKRYLDLLSARNKGVLSVVESSTVNLYAYLAEAEFVVGVSSTAIYEAISLNCNVILANLPSIEYMEALIINRHAMLITNSKELKAAITQKKKKVDKMDLLFWQQVT